MAGLDPLFPVAGDTPLAPQSPTVIPDRCLSRDPRNRPRRSSNGASRHRPDAQTKACRSPGSDSAQRHHESSNLLVPFPPPSPTELRASPTQHPRHRETTSVSSPGPSTETIVTSVHRALTLDGAQCVPYASELPQPGLRPGAHFPDEETEAWPRILTWAADTRAHVLWPFRTSHRLPQNGGLP